MRKIAIIIAMSSIVAYGQDKNDAPIYKCSAMRFSHYEPKYKDFYMKSEDGKGIVSISWGIDSVVSIRLIDSNEKQTIMYYKLIKTK
jgi:hypothetical protein